MGAWICKCGDRINDGFPNSRTYFFNENKEVDNVLNDIDKEFNNIENYKYDDYFNRYWDNLSAQLFTQCKKCGRLWFDSADNVVKENKIVELLGGESNIISFKPEPIFLEDSVDIMEELKRTADEINCEYELKYTNGKYTLKIDDKEINDESLSGVLQLLKYGKKY